MASYKFDYYFYNALDCYAFLHDYNIIPPAAYGQYLQKRKRRKKKPRDKGKKR